VEQARDAINSGRVFDGHGWVRTSDLSRVKSTWAIPRCLRMSPFARIAERLNVDDAPASPRRVPA
jgi:hypothetical protein